ncbi:MAG TPA: molybdopterin-dependent oxidoreductase [Candidatus Deferrimicrobium sp.]|nr:molybdopterin-dependent oxidoreductase [Candidatus Deferrimicrobium sp.]
MQLGRNLKIFIFFAVIIGITIPFLAYNFQTQNPMVWEIKISGNVEAEIIIQYQEIVDGDFGMIENRYFYYINSWGTERSYYVTGPSLWQVLNQTGVLRENSTQFYFKCVDNWVTDPLSLSDIEANPDYVLLAFKIDGQILKPKSEGGDGPIRAAVDFNLTKPDSNSEYWAKYLNQIIII